MNFGQFSNRVKASATAAASAARSFKGFDDMAANDEYIHSDDLNVRQRNRDNNNKNNNEVSLQLAEIRQEERGLLLNDEEQHQQKAGSLSSRRIAPAPASSGAPSRLSSVQQHHGRTLDDSARSLSMPLPPEHHASSTSPFRKGTPQRQETMPLLSVVSHTLSNNNENPYRKTAAAPQHEEGSGGDDSDRSSRNGKPNSLQGIGDDYSDDEDGEDPIMAMLRKDSSSAAAMPKKSVRGMDPMDGLEGSESSRSTTTRPKKDSNRFMDDLEERIANPALPTRIPTPPPLTPSSATSTTDAQPASFWLWSLANRGNNNNSTAAPPRTTTTPAPLSRQRQKKPSQKEDDFSVVASSAVFAEDELRQLLELQQQSAAASLSPQSNSSSLGNNNALGNLFLLIRENPRESFIVLTLVLSVLAYFYSHSLSAEDDIT